MVNKGLIRKKYLTKRKKNYFDVNTNYFTPLINLFRKKIKKRNINIAIYYPTSYEVDILKILKIEFFKKYNFLLPVIEKKNSMNFYHWKKNDILKINKYGIPEPIKSIKKFPSVIFVPLLAYDKKKNRLGYGGGFYDKFLNNFNKYNKRILTIGVAFSFQKYNNLPVQYGDFKLEHIITEKGII